MSRPANPPDRLLQYKIGGSRDSRATLQRPVVIDVSFSYYCKQPAGEIVMSTDVYKYKLSEKNGTHTIWILINDEPGPFNSWEEGQPISGCLIIGGGRLGTDSAGHHCRTPGDGNDEVLILRGASWSTSIGDTGDAELFAMQNSGAYYGWEMVDKTTK